MTFLGCGGGFVMGFLLANIRMSSGRSLYPLRLLATAYVEFFRRVPFLVILFSLFFTAKSVGIDWSLISLAILSIVVISTAFIAEIIRAGLETVPSTQWDAALSMNFSKMRTMMLVILPQAWRSILPPTFVYFVTFIKDTAVVSQVGVIELTQVGRYFSDKGTSALLSFGAVLVCYFVMSYPLMRFGWWLESRLHGRRIASSADIAFRGSQGG
ncbi:MAG: amino acid ABC transporter permease, partial [Nitrospirota bacterium]